MATEYTSKHPEPDFYGLPCHPPCDILRQAQDAEAMGSTLDALDDAVKSVGGLTDSVATTAQLAEIAKIIPEHWRPAAVGDAREGAWRWVDQFRAGADSILIHANIPEEFQPVLAEYARIRPHHPFEGRTNPPGA